MLHNRVSTTISYLLNLPSILIRKPKDVFVYIILTLNRLQYDSITQTIISILIRKPIDVFIYIIFTLK